MQFDDEKHCHWLIVIKQYRPTVWGLFARHLQHSNVIMHRKRGKDAGLHARKILHVTCGPVAVAHLSPAPLISAVTTWPGWPGGPPWRRHPEGTRQMSTPGRACVLSGPNVPPPLPQLSNQLFACPARATATAYISGVAPPVLYDTFCHIISWSLVLYFV